jgi:hypothetical protein
LLQELQNLKTVHPKTWKQRFAHSKQSEHDTVATIAFFEEVMASI